MQQLALLFTFTLLSIFSFGQSKKLKSFSEIKVSGILQVSIFYSDSNYFELNMPNSEFDISDIGIKYDGDELQIKHLSSLLKKEEVKLKVYCNKLTKIEAIHGAEISVKQREITESKKLNLTVFTGGKLNIDTNSDWIEASIKQGGSIKITGKTNHLKAEVITGGLIATSFLEAQNVDADIKMGGEIICYALDFLDAKIVSGGEINYKGNPKLKETIKMGGKINKVE